MSAFSFLWPLLDPLTLEELDRVVRMEGHDRLLPLAPASGRDPAALRLGLHPRRAHAAHADAEDVLDRLAHLSLVGALVHAERVLVGRQQRIALLRDDGPDDHLARDHFDAAFSVSRA